MLNFLCFSQVRFFLAWFNVVNDLRNDGIDMGCNLIIEFRFGFY